jgi:CheY-like chemotaxis protein
VSKQNLLLVDGDTRSLRVLEVSLRKAGFIVTPAISVKDALDKIELHVPDLIISETTFTNDVDGFELRRRLRGAPDWADIPFVFLTAQTAIEHKIRGLELGVDDYLTKPIYIKEIITRINILLQKRQRARFDERKDGVRFAGRVADMPVVDVIQTIEVSRKSGVINFAGPHGRQAAIYFREGKVIDAEAGTLQGEDAVYRLLTWNDGEFEVVFRVVRRRQVIQTSSQGLLMEGMRRLDEWSRLLEQLPPLSHRFEVDMPELSARLGEVPDDNNRILRLIDGKRTLIEVIDASDFGDLECLQAVSRLYFEGLLVDLDPHRRARRESGRPVPLVIVEETPTPIEEVASGPIDIAGLETQAIAPEPPPIMPPPEPEPEPAPEPEMIDEIIADDPDLEPGPDLDFDDEPPAPLLGSYRQSSLRLIDEAVAAAEAIEPSLFDDEPHVTNGASAHDHAIPAAIENDEPSLPSHADDFEIHDRPTDPSRRRPFASDSGPVIVEQARRDDSGLRMIGSLGRDRVEVSGELTPAKRPHQRADTARELITILPRRQTRDIPIVSAEPEPTPVTPALEPLPPPRIVSVAGGVSRATGPGLLAKLLLVGASLLTAMTVYMRCSKRSAAHHNAAAADAIPLDAPAFTGRYEARPVAVDAAVRAAAAPVDAAVRAVAPRIDAAVARKNSPPPPQLERQPDQSKLARELFDLAHKALADGDAARALELLDQSLALRKTARTYLERARVLEKLERLPEALDSIDKAMEVVKDYPPAWAMRGKMLHAAHDDQQAFPALRRYLELDPNGREAPEIRKILGESP